MSEPRLSLDSLTVAVELEAAQDAIDRNQAVIFSPDVAACLIDTIRGSEAVRGPDGGLDAEELIRAMVPAFRSVALAHYPAMRGDGWPSYSEAHASTGPLLVSELAEDILARLASDDAATPAAEGLDPDRLARAIQWDETPIGAILPPIQPFYDRAERIAAEYARLATAPDSPKEAGK